MDKVVTIPEAEYKRLLKRDEVLTALEYGGVDNWEWYSTSIQQYFEQAYGPDYDPWEE